MWVHIWNWSYHMWALGSRSNGLGFDSHYWSSCVEVSGKRFIPCYLWHPIHTPVHLLPSPPSSNGYLVECKLLSHSDWFLNAVEFFPESERRGSRRPSKIVFQNHVGVTVQNVNSWGSLPYKHVNLHLSTWVMYGNVLCARHHKNTNKKCTVQKLGFIIHRCPIYWPLCLGPHLPHGTVIGR